MLLVRSAASNPPNVEKMPNVVFFMSDDQDLHMNSMKFMPTVKKELSHEGITFQRHYCTMALCCPSRASLFSGKCVHNTNVTDVALPYGAYPKFVTEGINDNYLPLWLQDGGVNTYYVGKFMNGHNIHNYQKQPVKGWTSSNFLLEPGTYDYTNTTWTHDNQQYEQFPGINAIDITSKHALEMLETAVNAENPFFLVIAPAVPHVGINASVSGDTFFPIPQDKWANAFPDEVVPRNPNYNPVHQNAGASWILNMPRLNQSEIDSFDELYRRRLRCVAGLDDLVGDLLSALEKHKIMDNTHFIYSTDNGYHIGQHRLGPGKKSGFEDDINIPMVWRGPGIPSGKVIDDVSTHTDLAPTFLSLFKLPLKSTLDGQIIPAVTGTNGRSVEHINIEHWGFSNPYEVLPWNDISISDSNNNTYKGLRIVGKRNSFYYSVWCTNEHELYDMVSDEYQATNILLRTHDITSLSQKKISGWPLNMLVHRLDALLMVLKSCIGSQCIHPWLELHPQGNVKTLEDAMHSKYDAFYLSQPKVSFSACVKGYLIEYEGPQSVISYAE
ncbi:alkaline-phosphatase-like protein [Mariannaea sp. PMI_226]|nr:alkaline-phosphatase-like protein [Mariannaea sp. PMI_226]